jgi:hypothetical protein
MAANALVGTLFITFLEPKSLPNTTAAQENIDSASLRRL